MSFSFALLSFSYVTLEIFVDTGAATTPSTPRLRWERNGTMLFHVSGGSSRSSLCFPVDACFLSHVPRVCCYLRVLGFICTTLRSETGGSCLSGGV
ncbi:hypothetical protein BGZ61DRAFT_440252 [Ilyonectria robusta]|uniref:uncharacterized protein n=1 Tax=Ilyonectria robusta TaxID=1079257 RepID=UPI001E8CA2A0|nr:uncharacterized protein BGZ61DRAFT_440252 [Ilyonectria robusta]KAH8735440.1 hypothetical protein BGZ61DRAFT_440252 [Ilyonectria robusta]